MTDMPESKRVRDLQRLLEQLRSLYEELFSLVESKIAAMKRADVTAMTDCAAREIALVERLHERESFRGQLMDALGAELGLPARMGRTMTISQLADRVCEPQQEALLGAAEKLRVVLMKVTQAHRVAGAVSLELLNHLRWVLAAVKPRGGQANLYTGAGAFVPCWDSALLETVG